ncbi:MAG: hypothetical protein KC635_27370, partial [Myxococcales bacterium]|nr:hypothetical protein [Myxococcales bacterium]
MRRASNIALACVLMGACGGEGAQGDASDATAPADVDTAAPADTTSPDGDTVDGDTATGPLATCDGPAAVYVEREAGDAPEVIAYANGDLAIRGYASRCGDDGDVDAFTLRGCLGPLSAWLTWAEGASTLDVRIAVPAQDGLVLDSAGEPAGHVLTADLAAPAGGGPLDVEVTVRCRAGEPTAWSLVLDTASTAPVPTADNGWPLDLYPADYAVCEDGRFPRIEGALDEYGATDVSLGQFYGDMLLVEVGGVWCYPCTLFARESAALHDEVEALSDAWGFSIVEV